MAARCSTRLRHWQRVGSRAAADEGNKTGGSGMSSSSLSPYAGGDLQNNRKHYRQLILIFLFVQVRFGSAALFGFVILSFFFKRQI
jgi:hypothetical protein